MHEHKADLRASKFTLDPTLESELPVELTIETTSETEVLAAELAKSAANQEYNAASKTDVVFGNHDVYLRAPATLNKALAEAEVAACSPRLNTVAISASSGEHNTDLKASMKTAANQEYDATSMTATFLAISAAI